MAGGSNREAGHLTSSDVLVNNACHPNSLEAVELGSPRESVSRSAASFALEIVPTIATIARMNEMSINTDGDKLFTTVEAADYLGYAEDTVRRYIYRGLLGSQKFGNAIAIAKSECDRFRKAKRSPGRPTKEK